MSTLNPTYVPVSAGLSSFSGGPESALVKRMTAHALGQLALQSHAQAALNDLFNLKQEATDAGQTLSPETVETCKRFLLAWPKAMPMPELALDTDGEVMLDWAGPHRSLVSVSLRHDGRVSYAAQLGAWRRTHGVEAFDDSVPAPVVDAVRALYSD